MKLLLDQNLSRPRARTFEPLFPGWMHVALVGLDRATGADVWA